MIEKVITVGIKRPNQTQNQFYSSMEELRRLVETAGGQVIGEFHQKKDRLDPATLLGKGKIAEVAGDIKSMGAKTVIFDDDLTPAQQKNIEKIIPAKIVDRTRLILDIFAQRARTKEGQLQIELAQLNYVVPRLTGAWRGYSQQSGGIGTRGPGEKKIEVERRHVRDRIKRLKKEIEDIRDHRDRARNQRDSVPLPQIALIGYTNVGKSTLLNNLVNEQAVYADDKLFATLDPTTRRVKLPDGRVVLFTDTVGFIQKLPHDLVAAFRATLEEVCSANLLLHVIDATAEDRLDQQKTVLDVVKTLGADHIPIINVYNKVDLIQLSDRERLLRDGGFVISGKTGWGVSQLLKAIEQQLDAGLLEVQLDLPHNKRALLASLYQTAHIISQNSTDQGTHLKIRIDENNWKRISEQLKNGK